MTAPAMAPVLLSLKQAGESVTMRVTGCAPLAIGKYPELEIVGTDGAQLVAVRMPIKSAERQFARANLTYADALGKTLTISRDPNNLDASKPYWGITVQPNGSAPVAATAPQQQPPPEYGPPIPGLDVPELPDARKKLASIFALQDDCFKHALTLSKYAAEKYQVALTLEGISALTAQAMIEASRQGVKL